MITVTVTIADGGQGSVHDAVSVCRSLDFGMRSITDPAAADLVRKYTAEAADDVVTAAIDQYLGDGR